MSTNRSYYHKDSNENVVEDDNKNVILCREKVASNGYNCDTSDIMTVNSPGIEFRSTIYIKLGNKICCLLETQPINYKQWVIKKDL